MVGGGSGSGGGLSAELYAPAAGSFAATGSATVAGQGHRATLLKNVTVLVAGGINMNSAAFPNEKRTEPYDPNIGIFTPTGSMTTMRGDPAVTLLSDGRVLVAGGRYDTSAELYHPGSDTFTVTGSMTVQRVHPTRDPRPGVVGRGARCVGASAVRKPDVLNRWPNGHFAVAIR